MPVRDGGSSLTAAVVHIGDAPLLLAEAVFDVLADGRLQARPRGALPHGPNHAAAASELDHGTVFELAVPVVGAHLRVVSPGADITVELSGEARVVLPRLCGDEVVHVEGASPFVICFHRGPEALLPERRLQLHLRSVSVDVAKRSCRLVWGARLGMNHRADQLAVSWGKPETAPSTRSQVTADVPRDHVPVPSTPFIRGNGVPAPAPILPGAPWDGEHAAATVVRPQHELQRHTSDVSREALAAYAARVKFHDVRSLAQLPVVLEDVAFGYASTRGLGGVDDFEVVRFSGGEALSAVYRYDVTLRRRAFDGDPRDLLGAWASLRIHDPGSGAERWVHGVIAEARDGAPGEVSVAICAPLWLSRYRHGGDLGYDRTAGSVGRYAGFSQGVIWRGGGPDVVQSRAGLRGRQDGGDEHDLGMLSRRLTEEGLVFFFRNEAARHDMIVEHAHLFAGGADLPRRGRWVEAEDVVRAGELTEAMVASMDAQGGHGAPWREDADATEVVARTTSVDVVVGQLVRLAGADDTWLVVREVTCTGAGQSVDSPMRYSARLRCAPTPRGVPMNVGRGAGVAGK